MLTSDGVLFLLEDNVRDWILAEYGIARAQNKVIGLLTTNVEPPPEPFPRDLERLIISTLDADATPSILKYLHSMKKKVESVNELLEIVKPAYIREFVKHRIILHSDGRLLYETDVQMKCLRDGLSDLTHSIHMNFSLCSPGAQDFDPTVLELINLDPDHQLSFTLVANDSKKSTWKLSIDPPLRHSGRINYGWRNNFRHYLTLTREELEHLFASANHPLPDGRVKHHWFINHPTEDLELQLQIYDSSLFSSCEVLAYVGRTVSTRTIDDDEVNRIRNQLSITEFLGRTEITLAVSRPRLNYTYAIIWTLNRAGFENIPDLA